MPKGQATKACPFEIGVSSTNVVSETQSEGIVGRYVWVGLLNGVF
jgi:hypothetical protein